MNERIKKLAEQAYALCGKHNNDYNGLVFTETFAALVAAQEREECEKLCMAVPRNGEYFAELIRARGTR